MAAGQSQSAKDSAMAAHLIKAGYPHGRRRTRPCANSGGITAVNAAGSSNYQRLMAGSA